MNEEDDEPEIEFFPEPLQADSVELDENGNLKIGLRMDDDQLQEFIESIEQFNRLREAQEEGKSIEFLANDNREPTALDYLE